MFSTIPINGWSTRTVILRGCFSTHVNEVSRWPRGRRFLSFPPVFNGCVRHTLVSEASWSTRNQLREEFTFNQHISPRSQFQITSPNPKTGRANLLQRVATPHLLPHTIVRLRLVVCSLPYKKIYDRLPDFASYHMATFVNLPSVNSPKGPPSIRSISLVFFGNKS